MLSGLDIISYIEQLLCQMNGHCLIMKSAVVHITFYHRLQDITCILMVLFVPVPNQLKSKCSKHVFSLIRFRSIRQSAMLFVKDLTLFHLDVATIGG